jgi:hypothetical protein
MSAKFWWRESFRETRREVDERILEEANSCDSEEKPGSNSNGQRHGKLLPASHPTLVIQRSAPFLLADDQGSPQFAAPSLVKECRFFVPQKAGASE